jgi:hypothetical protein
VSRINLPRKRGHIDIEVSGDPKHLAISGSIYEPGRPHTDRFFQSGGQIYDTLLQEFPDNPKVHRLVDLWKRWHLNDMRPGCEHQRAAGWDKEPIDPTKPLDTYGLFPPNTQTSWNMKGWLPASLGGYLSAPCPVCGYKYGTAWIHEPLPDDVVDELLNLRDLEAE